MLKRLKGGIARELHIDAPLLAEATAWAVDQVVATGVDIFEVRPAAVSARIADGIEDFMGYAGDGLWHHYAGSLEDWRADVLVALSKAQRLSAAAI